MPVCMALCRWPRGQATVAVLAGRHDGLSEASGHGSGLTATSALLACSGWAAAACGVPAGGCGRLRGGCREALALAAA